MTTELEIRAGRAASVAGMDVVRVLPTRRRRTVGPWCFVDLMSPDPGEEPDPMEVGPHPHIGLATVTWLLEGEAVHSDSLGTEQTLRPGQLNLMSAGHGIAHAEQVMERQPFRGVQLWLAQPDATRDAEPGFEHHGELPEVELDGGLATVLVGELHDVRSPAREDSPTLGAQVQAEAGRLPITVDPAFEHALVPLDGTMVVDGRDARRGDLLLLGDGRDELVVELPDDARFLLLGGLPWTEGIRMWWNFVGRSEDEITTAWRSWQDRDERFGVVPSPLERIDAPLPPWLGAG